MFKVPTCSLLCELTIVTVQCEYTVSHVLTFFQDPRSVSQTSGLKDNLLLGSKRFHIEFNLQCKLIQQGKLKINTVRIWHVNIENISIKRMRFLWRNSRIKQLQRIQICIQCKILYNVSIITFKGRPLTCFRNLYCHDSVIRLPWWE